MIASTNQIPLTVAAIKAGAGFGLKAFDRLDDIVTPHPRAVSDTAETPSIDTFDMPCEEYRHRTTGWSARLAPARNCRATK